MVESSRTIGSSRTGTDRDTSLRDALLKLDTRPEDSLGLRILVQLLVIVGIIATDIAASDVTAAWQATSYWAIPLSIAGSCWSWRCRRRHNIAVKFLLAIGMLLALVLFFGRLLGELNDTRLALAQLLIQLQVLHSFDMPRRKDLGYSMVIGLILLGVAGTLSQTLAFAPTLFLFIAIALPTLVLDYRSRLGLTSEAVGSRSLKQTLAKAMPLNWRQIGLLLFTVLLLGLTIFLFLPRLPGYQLRTFPVSAPVEFEGQFDPNRVVNPGYVGAGRNGTGNGNDTFGTDGVNGEAGAQGPGTFDDRQYYGFGNQINQNLRGELKPQVVMRVRSQSEGYWRVMGFDRYTGQGWEVSRNDQAKTIDRLDWLGYRFVLDRPITLNRYREVVQTYTIVAEEMPNVIPALLQPKEVYFPTRQIAIDTEESLRSPLALTEGFTYTVVSEVPFRDRTRLREATQKYPKAIQDYYLDVPAEIRDRIRSQTETILAKSEQPLTDPYEKALYLTQYLKQNYQILPDLPIWKPGTDMVESFLFVHQGGYPDHFSTTLAIMLRAIGIPTRLATGFGAGQFNPFTGMYIVRNTDAYAVAEVYFPKYGWFAFDPIPGHELFPPTVRDYEAFTVLEKFWKWVAGWLPSPVRNWFGQIFVALAGWLIQGIRWLIGLFTQGWLGFFFGLIVLTIFGFIGWLLWNLAQTWQKQRRLARLAPMERLYRQMLDWLAVQGFRKPVAQTPLEYADHFQVHHPDVETTDLVDQISQAYVRWRYGGESVDVAKLHQQFQKLQQRSPIRWRKQPIATR